MAVNWPGSTRAPLALRPRLGVELHRHQAEQALRQLAREGLVERAVFGEPGDALRGVGLLKAPLDRQRAHAVHDGKDAAFLEIQRRAAERGPQRGEQAERRRELVDGAGEMGEPRPLAAHRRDQFRS